MIPHFPPSLGPRPKLTFRCGLSRFGAGLVLCISTVLIPLQASAGVKVTYATEPQIRAMFIKLARPNYPYEARAARMTGSGIFRLYINPDGRVKTVGVIKSTGHPSLDLAAAGGLYRSLLKPGRHREIDMPVTFTMTRP